MNHDRDPWKLAFVVMVVIVMIMGGVLGITVSRLHEEIDARGKQALEGREALCQAINVDRRGNRVGVEALVQASAARRDSRTSEEEEGRRRAIETYQRLMKPALREIDCNDFIKDPSKYLRDFEAQKNGMHP